MAWVRIEDEFADNPKIIDAGESGVCLFVCGLAYCGHMLTDGVIPKRKALVLYPMNDAKAAADDLVRVGLWEDAGDSYLVHDYLHYQKSRAQIEEERAKSNARVGKYRTTKPGSSAQQARNGDVTALQERYEGESNGVCNAAPIPIPIPIPIPSPEPTPTPNDGTPSFVGSLIPEETDETTTHKTDSDAEQKPRRSTTRRQQTQRVFVEPTEQECIDYGRSIGLSELVCMKFYATMVRDGWTTGKQQKPIVSWKGAMNTWNVNEKIYGQQAGAQQSAVAQPYKPTKWKSELEEATGEHWTA